MSITLQTGYRMYKELDPITSFRGDYEFLSNFYPCKIVMDFGPFTMTFDNAESAFQAHKSPLCDDLLKFEGLTGAQAKKLGRKVHLRDDWNDIKVNVMRKVIYEKFHQNYDLRLKLIDTVGRQLVEGNTWNDTFWGMCNGKGKNMLGQILMECRDRYTDPFKDYVGY